MSNPYKARDFTRFNIHKNKKGQNIYIEKRSDTAYILDEKDIKRVQLFHSRPFYAAALGVLLYGFLELNIYICVAVALVVAIVLEFYFRKVFLTSLPRTNNLEGIVIRDVNEIRLSQTDGTLWVKVIGYFAGGIAVAVIVFFTDYPLWQKICIYVFSAYAFYNGVMNLLAILNKEKNK